MSTKPGIDISDEVLTVDQVVTLLPLMREAKRLEGTLRSGGALHIVLEDGNYENDHIQYCIRFIESGEYAKADWCNLKEMEAELALAKAILPLTPQQREMVCEFKTCTEDLFDLVMNHDHVEKQ